MLRNILYVAKREYLERVRSRVFRITTILVPVGVGALLFIGQTGNRKMAVIPNLAIVSNDPMLAAQVRAALLADAKSSPPTISVDAPETAESIAEIDRQVASHQIAGYLRLEIQPGHTQPDASWVSTNSVDFIRKAQMESAIRRGLMSQELLARGVSPDRVHDLMKNVSLTTMSVRNGVVAESNSERSFTGAYALIIVLYGAVLIYGINVARSVVEEKTSRIFEVMLSVSRADDLLAGKLLGVGAVGLTQIAIWVAAAVAFSGSALAASLMTGDMKIQFTLMEGIFFPIYFVLGFFLYSAFFSGLAATCETAQELQMYMPLAAAPVWLSFAIAPLLINDPNSIWTLVASFFPATAPFVMMLRMGLQAPPAWQFAVSIGLMVVSVWAVLWFSSRLYRVGILMYGKRATLPEILRWLRYS